MRLDRRLNLIVPVARDAGGSIYVHSSPISREVFEEHFLVISKTFAAIYAEGLNMIAGPRVAALLLRRVASTMGAWEGDGGVANGLLNEVRRLSNVAMPGDSGWTTLPLHDAAQRGLLTEDEVSEAEGAIVFFTCVSAMHRKADIAGILEGMGSLWGTQTTLLNSTEFAASLPTSTETASSTPTIPASSVPS